MAYKEDKVISGVYKITHIKSGRLYIGSSNHIYKRWATHKSSLNNNRHENKYLQHAWNKYGEDQFEFEIIETTEPQNLYDRERYWIDITSCLDRSKGFNIYPDPAGLERLPLSNEHKRKLSNALKGRHPSKTHRINLSKALKGKKKPAHVMEALRQANLGKEWTDKQREKRSELSKGSNNGRAKLNEQSVQDVINDLIYGYGIKFIARKYKISTNTIRRILARENWQHIMPEVDILLERNKRLSAGKICSSCDLWKPWSDYTQKSERYVARCIPCYRKYNRENQRNLRAKAKVLI